MDLQGRRNIDAGLSAEVSSDKLRERLRAEIGASSEGIPTDALSERLAVSVQALGDPLERLKGTGGALGFAGWWMTPEQWRSASERISKVVQAAKARDLTIQQLHASLGLEASIKSFDRMLRQLAVEGAIRFDGRCVGAISKPGSLLPRVIEAMESGSLTAPSERNLARHLGLPIQAVEAAIAEGIVGGQMFRFKQSFLFTKAQLEGLAEEMNRNWHGRKFTIGDARASLSVSRNVLPELLDWMRERGWWDWSNGARIWRPKE